MNELNRFLLSVKVGEAIPNDPETSKPYQTTLNEMTVASSDSVIYQKCWKVKLLFRRPAWLLGAVAAALLVIVAVPLFRSGDSSTTQIASEIIEEPDGESVESALWSESTDRAADLLNLHLLTQVQTVHPE